MEIRRGIVTATVTASSRMGGEYIVSVDLDGYRIKLKHEVHKPFEISIGDQLAFFGQVKNGIFHGHAYRNLSSGRTSATQVKAMLCVALVYMVISCLLLTIASSWLLKTGGLLFSAGAVYSIYFWNFTSKGLRQLTLLPTESTL